MIRRYQFIQLHFLIFIIGYWIFKCSNISRGFGFITFGDPASVDKVLAHGTHELDGKKVSYT